MRNIKLKPTLFLLLGISIIAFVAIKKVQRVEDITLWSLVAMLSKVVTFDTIIIGLFTTYLWKWKLFQHWLVPFPDLNGTWKGNIISTWEDPITNQRPDPIPVELVVKQTFFKVSCVMRTAEMNSSSMTSDFVIEPDHQLKRLVYTYDSRPNAAVRDRSPQHYGTMYFDVVENPKRILRGEYWTDRKTTGLIELVFSKKERTDKYLNNEKHPVSAIRNNNS